MSSCEPLTLELIAVVSLCDNQPHIHLHTDSAYLRLISQPNLKGTALTEVDGGGSG